jgi:hypothetical protein
MRKIKTIQFMITIFIGLFFVSIPFTFAEEIDDFNAVITVLPNASLFVEEEITYDFNTSIRRGITRSISLLNSKNELMQIEIVSVLDEYGNIYEYTFDILNNVLNIKISDQDRIISGIKEYHISYRVLGAINYYKDFDEIHWHAIGFNLGVPIKKAEVRVVLPSNVYPIRQDCYYGDFNNKIKCSISESGIFSMPSISKEQEGLTTIVSFPKGAVSVYQSTTESIFIKFGKTFWPILIPIIVFIFMFMVWYKKGKNPKGVGAIVPKYNIPDSLTPIEVADIVNGQINSSDISAEIIYLAINGYLKIKQINKKMSGLVLQKDYEFTLLKEEGLCVNDFDRQIITAIFENKGKVGGVSKLSSLHDNFYMFIPSIVKKVNSGLLKKKYYTNFSKFINKKNILVWVLLLSISLFVIQFFDSRNNFDSIKQFLIFLSSFLISVIIWLIFSQLMSAKSIKGVETKEYLLGVKEYLYMSEKSQINSPNTPQKNPEVFEHFLPYAMIFNIEEIWAKKFNSIYINPPKWYESKIANFNAIHFSKDITAFSLLATDSFSSDLNNTGDGSSAEN